MVAETAKKFEALEAQAHKIMTVFMKAGYEAVAPAAIQPASVFLDVIGETLRARTYVFTDPDGEELCLRPDLTVPTCRLHIERHSDPMVRAKYCYNGSAFRFQPSDAPVAHPREFRQAGIESFGATDRAKAEAEVVVTVLNALKAAGLSEFKLHIGDLGLFRALLDAADMPLRWRRRLMHQFWRPEAFRTELKRLTTAAFDMHHNLPKDLLTGLDPEDQPKSRLPTTLKVVTLNFRARARYQRLPKASYPSLPMPRRSLCRQTPQTCLKAMCGWWRRPVPQVRG